jgi:hypothetical protein
MPKPRNPKIPTDCHHHAPISPNIVQSTTKKIKRRGRLLNAKFDIPLHDLNYLACEHIKIAMLEDLTVNENDQN